MVWVLMFTSDRLEVLELDPEPVYTLPTLSTHAESRRVLVVAKYGDAVELRSPGMDGVVTAVLIESGQTVKNWDEVIAVDGVSRVALHTAEPFYRPLAFGARGTDVLQLEQLLAEAGLLEEVPDEVFSRETEAAIKGLEAQLGVVRPVGVFQPEYVVWLPLPEMVVDSIHVSVSDRGLPAGEPIADSERPLTSLRLIDSSGADLSELVPGQYELYFGSTAAGRVVDSAALGSDLQQAFLRYRADQIDRLGGEFDEAQSLEATLRLVDELRVTVVPTSAVATDLAGGQTCLWVRDGAAHRALPVVVVGGTLGATEVAELLPDEMEILVNPLDILEDASCPSA